MGTVVQESNLFKNCPSGNVHYPVYSGGGKTAPFIYFEPLVSRQSSSLSCSLSPYWHFKLTPASKDSGPGGMYFRCGFLEILDIVIKKGNKELGNVILRVSHCLLHLFPKAKE